MSDQDMKNVIIDDDGSFNGGLSQFKESIFDSYGIPVITGTELKPCNLVSMGPFILDYACYGGAPDNAPSMLHGVKSSGKSTITLQHIKEIQIKYPDKHILYGAIEKGCFQPDWADSIGVDRSRLHVVTPQYGEEWVEILYNAIKTNKFSHIIVDSTPELLPKDDVEKDASDEARMAANSKIIGKMITKYNSATVWLHKFKEYRKSKGQDIDIHIPSIMLINQRREMMNSKYPTANLPGGQRLKHFPLMIMELKNSDLSDESSDKELVKSTHNFNLGGSNNKNKATGRLIKTGEFDISVSDEHPRVGRGGIDDFATVIKYAKRYGLVSGAGVNQRLATSPDIKFKSMGMMATMLSNDEELYWLTRACIIAKARLKHGLDMMPPDDYLQRCTSNDIIPILQANGDIEIEEQPAHVSINVDNNLLEETLP